MYAVIIGLNDFPDNDAGAVRDLAFAKIYQQLGYDVIVISQGRQKNIYKYKGLTYASFDDLNKIDDFQGSLSKNDMGSFFVLFWSEKESGENTG